MIEETDSTDGFEEFKDRNETWESNHIAIATAIEKVSRELERYPKKTEIAAATGLSVRTVYNHMLAFNASGRTMDELCQLKFMTGNALNKIMELALDGDLKACRLMLEIVGVLDTPKKGGEGS